MLISVDVEVAGCFAGHSQATAEPAQSHQRKEMRARGNSSLTSAYPWWCSKCECGRQDSRKNGSSGKKPYSWLCSQDRRLKLVVNRSPALAWESASCLCMVQFQLQAAAGEKAGSCWWGKAGGLAALHSQELVQWASVKRRCKQWVICHPYVHVTEPHLSAIYLPCLELSFSSFLSHNWSFTVPMIFLAVYSP